MVHSALPSISTERIHAYLRNCVRIDTRTLAVFRVFLGLLIVADMLLRSRNFSFYYTDDGLVPQELATSVTSEGAFSFYFMTSNPDLLAALFVIQALIAVQLIVGYRTRLATILSFLFVISLDHHNPLVTSYADIIFRLLLFWAMFLPLGERWSIDAVHRDRAPRASVASIASFLILGQMVFMYVVNALHKVQSSLWREGDAAPLVLGLDEMTYLIGDIVREFSVLLQIGGLTWLYLLSLSWLMFFLRGRPRMLFAGMLMAGHASFALTVRIGAFSYVCITGLTLFLQAQFWDDLSTVANRVGLLGSRLAALPDRLARVAGYVPDIRIDSPRIRKGREELHTVAIILVVASMVLFSTITFLQFAGAIQGELGPEQEIENVAQSFSADQPEWGVFAPTPRTTDRYYVFAAVDEDGEYYDVYNDRELRYDRPHEELQKQHGTYRERFFMNSVRRGSGSDPHIRELVADDICTTWDDERDITLTHINMYEITEDVTHDTVQAHEDRDQEWNRFYHHGCDDRNPTIIQPPEDFPRAD
ncbi:HTTM domain-containing protein [Halobacteria archaeon AArc-dxtr1]|nr:HTTM domain-containing protein [Halobacteria archaeon AArc-dxtr1]